MTERSASACAREFRDPEGATTWRVRLVRSGAGPELSLWGGRLGPLALRFENGVETRHLEPAPLDWRECDDAALWRYCRSAMLVGIRPALLPAPARPNVRARVTSITECNSAQGLRQG